MIRCLVISSLSLVLFGCLGEDTAQDEYVSFAVTTPEQEAACLDAGKALVCHYPPGRHPDKSFVICIAEAAVDAHIDDADGIGHELDFVVDRSDPDQPACGSDDDNDGGDGDGDDGDDDDDGYGDAGVPIVE